MYLSNWHISKDGKLYTRKLGAMYDNCVITFQATGVNDKGITAKQVDNVNS